MSLTGFSDVKTTQRVWELTAAGLSCWSFRLSVGMAEPSVSGAASALSGKDKATAQISAVRVVAQAARMPGWRGFIGFIAGTVRRCRC